MLKKIILISVISLLGLYALFCLALNFIVIPELIRPAIDKELMQQLGKGMKFTVGKISFYPLEGFVLRDVNLTGPVQLSENYILKAKSVTLRIDFLALLAKCLKIDRLSLEGAQLSFGRDASGVWNITPLLQSDIFKGGEFSFVLNQLQMSGGVIDYEDLFRKDDTLRRRFTGAELILTALPGGSQRLNISTQAESEFLKARIAFNPKASTFSGNIQAQTPYLDQYWDYYLDEWLKPWYLRSKRVGLGLNFSYADGILDIDGQYNIDQSRIHYGDLNISGNVEARHEQRLVKNNPQQDYLRLKIHMDELSSSSGEFVFLQDAQCQLYVTKDAFTIEGIQGYFNKRKVDLNGRLKMSSPQEISLSGKIADVDNKFLLRILSDNKVSLEWHSAVGASLLDIRADITDLKDHAFNLSAQGALNLEDLGGLLMTEKAALKGKMSLKGGLRGQLDKPNTLQGGFDLNARDLSLYEFGFQNFDLNLKAQDGLFTSEVPRLRFCKGYIFGQINFDSKRWGLEFDAQKLDLQDFGEHFERLRNIKGIMSGNIALVAPWEDFNSAAGGGYLKLSHCDLRKAPVFSEAEKGIASVKKDFSLPEFEMLEGNFSIADKAIAVDNGVCRAYGMGLGIKGKYGFNGQIDLTIAATVWGGNTMKTLRQLLLPETIGLDMLTNTLCVNISGKIPDIKNKTGVQTTGWLTDFFRLLTPIEADKYKLKKLWEKHSSPE